MLPTSLVISKIVNYSGKIAPSEMYDKVPSVKLLKNMFYNDIWNFFSKIFESLCLQSVATVFSFLSKCHF